MKNFAYLVLGLLLVFSIAFAAPVEMKTRTMDAKGSKVTIVHFGAPWCGPCVKMEPAMQAFESSYKSKANMVMINVDEKGTPEYKKYSALVDKVGSIPFTVWLDSKGNSLGEKIGGLSEQELASRTDAAAKKAK